MKDGKCPKCSGTEVYSHQPNVQSSSESISLNNGLIFIKGAMPRKYLCMSCGYLEYYLTIDEKVSKAVETEWEKV